MPSDNKLLGSGKPIIKEKDGIVFEKPILMYNKEFPMGKPVYHKRAMNRMLSEGWSLEPSKEEKVDLSKAAKLFS